MVYLDKKEYLMSPKILRRLAVGAAVFLLILILPWPHESFELPVILKPAATLQVSAPADATVASVAVGEGDQVMPGSTLAVLTSRSVESRIRELTARKGGFEGSASLSRAEASAAGSTEFESRAGAAASALLATEAVRSALVVRAPAAGTILTHRPQDLLGSSVAAGAPLFELGDTRTMRVEIPVTERLLQSIRVGEPVSLHVRALPFRRFRVKITEIAPAAEKLPATSSALEAPLRPGEIPERFIAVALVENGDGELASGMEAEAKLIGARSPFAVQWWNVIYHWARRVIW
jgi:multidrug efflux pump subunit AcrA (membrane-fusion protein)